MEQWELHEYASPIGTFFIKVAGSGRVIASSLKCGRDRAALIAAAPELLEALKRWADNPDGWSVDQVNEAHALIRKATS